MDTMKDRMNAGMRALGAAVDKTLKSTTDTERRAESAQVADALREVASAIDRLADAVRTLRNEPETLGR